MQRVVTRPAQRNGEFVAGLARQRARLGEAQMMGSAGDRPRTRQGCAATNWR
jgi:hypothetical protein